MGRGIATRLLAGGHAVTLVGKDRAQTGMAAVRVRTVGSMGGTSRAAEFLFGFETEHSRRHAGELEAGHTLVVVWVENGTQADRVGEILARHGGHFVYYYSRRTARNLVP